MKKILPALLLCLMAVSFNACDTGSKNDKTYLLKMNLNKGDKFGYDMNMDIEMDLMNMKMKMEIGTQFEVMDSTAAGKDLKITYTKLTTKMDMAGNPMAGVTDSMLNESNSKMIGKSVILTLAGNKIVDVKGIRELQPDSTDSVVQKTMEKMFSKENLNSMFGMMFNLYPDKPVKAGDSWTADNSVDMAGMNMNLKSKYTLLQVKDGIADIAVEGTLGTNGSMSQQGMKINLELSGTQKGKMNIKLADGYLKDGNYDMDVDAKIDMMGQKMPMKMKIKSTMKGN